MSLTKEDIAAIDRLVGASVSVANALYNTAQNTPMWHAAQLAVTECDEARRDVYAISVRLKESLIDQEVLEAWKKANMPAPQETWIAGYLAAKQSTKP